MLKQASVQASEAGLSCARLDQQLACDFTCVGQNQVLHDDVGPKGACLSRPGRQAVALDNKRDPGQP